MNLKIYKLEIFALLFFYWKCEMRILHLKWDKFRGRRYEFISQGCNKPTLCNERGRLYTLQLITEELILE